MKGLRNLHKCCVRISSRHKPSLQNLARKWFHTTTQRSSVTWHPCGSKFVSTFKDHEVYDGHREDHMARDGPTLFRGNEAEYLLIGGGIMGQALACNLWKKLEKVSAVKAYKHLGSCTTAIVEPDPTLATSSTALSVGGIRSQFSNRANIVLSLESSEFIRNIKLHLSTVRNQDPDVQFNPQGYLIMATGDGADQLMASYNLQTSSGAKVMLLSRDRLKETFPFLEVDDIELAAYGLENEGWFDPMSLVCAFKHKNTSFPITNVTGKVVGFKKEILKGRKDAYVSSIETLDGRTIDVDDRLDGVYVETPDYDKPVYVKCHTIFNCAGHASGRVASMAGIGDDSPDVHPFLKHKLPVEPRKRYVYVVHCPDAPLLDCPFVIDPSGFYVRREGLGGKYICGMSPPEDEEPAADNLEVDYDFFNDEIWPRLAKRIPAFEKLKVTSAWAGYYDYNTYDQNAIIGPHPYYTSMNFLTGFSGHGIQQACAAAEKLADLTVRGVDMDATRHALTEFAFDRVIDNRPMLEANII